MSAHEHILKSQQALLNGSGKLGYFEARGITEETLKRSYIGYESGAFLYPCFSRKNHLLGVHFKSGRRDAQGKRKQWWGQYAADLPGKGHGKKADAPAKVIPFGLETLQDLEPGALVILCCGEEDALSLRQVGYMALSQPGAGLLEPVYAKEFAGFEVVVFYDAGEEQQAREDAMKLRQAGAREVRVVEWPLEAPYGEDINGRLVEDPESFEEWLANMINSAVPLSSLGAKDTNREGEPDRYASEDGESEKRRPTQAELLLRLSEEAELFHTPEGDSYATVAVGSHRETHPVRSRGFRRWLVRSFYEEHGKPPGAQALQDALGVLEAKAQFDGPEHPVYVRVAEHDGAIYVDLANNRWQAVKITDEGWEVVSDPPVHFRRARGMLPLPVPSKKGMAEQLRRSINLGDKDEASWRLLLAWLIQALRPTGPYPVLILQGEQGSAKSTVERLLRALIDPSTAPLRTTPKSERDLIIAANNSWAVAFDNISNLPPWLSDAICRLSTGGGFSARELYTDSEEVLFDAMRPVILNGISDLVTRPDLLDRALIVTLPYIPEERRKPEKVLWREFEGQRPVILGALFSAVSHALKKVGSVQLEGIPRMADFAVWAVAAEGAFGWKEGAFMEAYAGNRKEANETALEADPVAEAIRKFVEVHEEWSGTATDFWKELGSLVDEDVKHSKSWPGAANALSARLKRLAPVLREIGIEYGESQEPGKGSRKKKSLRKLPEKTDAADATDAGGEKDPQNAEKEARRSSDDARGGTDANENTDAHKSPVNEGVGVDGVDSVDDSRPHSRLVPLLDDRPDWICRQARKCLDEGRPKRLVKPFASSIALEYLGDVRRWHEALPFVEENLEDLV